MKKYVLPCALLLLALVIVVSGCGGGSTSGESSGKPQADTPDATQVRVEQIAKSPMEYDNKIVTTEGNYAVGYCSACFLLKDGVSAVRVEVSDTAPLPPESRLTARMKVTGKIYVANGSPNIVASKIEYL